MPNMFRSVEGYSLCLDFINSLNASIKFTVEREQNSKLPFLDLLISRNSSGNLSFAVYRKPSHTGNYLKFDSNHPQASSCKIVSRQSEESLQCQ